MIMYCVVLARVQKGAVMTRADRDRRGIGMGYVRARRRPRFKASKTLSRMDSDGQGWPRMIWARQGLGLPLETLGCLE